MKYTILVIDDSSTIRTVLSQTIEMTHLPIDQILQASHGQEALELIENEWVDIIFCDINMPTMNGVEFIKRKNEHPEFQIIPVAVVSTEGSETRKEELKEMGVQYYLRKPCRPEEIRDVIFNVLGRW